MPILGLNLSNMGGCIEDTKHSSIGDGVILDSLYPENIIIHNHVHITMRCVILTHYLDTKKPGIAFKKGIVELCDNCFIGANTVVKKGVTIGENSVIGMNSVVTHDIPANSIAVGIPCKVIRKIETKLYE